MTRYKKINSIVNHDLYQFIKIFNISVLNYKFNYYFDFYIKHFNIKLLEHHFTNREIYGLTVKDSKGVSISYEKNNPLTRQNFTKCHELGHIILNHDGRIFTELNEVNSINEYEANFFSASLLMPDIVLISKIFFRRDSFQKIKLDLSVSSEALFLRLKNVLVYNTELDEFSIEKALKQYRENKNLKILELFSSFHKKVIDEFVDTKLDNLLFFQYKVKMDSFVTSQTFPDLLNRKFCKKVTSQYNFISTWAEYNFGKTISFAWNNTTLTKKEAQSRAKTILLLTKLD
ncbi:ImmA/IrrE family metallo-endopeptidase [Streptococcus suis]